MTNEQREAIEIIEKMIKSYIEADECGLSNNDFKYEIKAMQTLLSLIKDQEEEKQRYKIAFNQQVEVLKDTVKKLNDSISTQKVIDKIEEIEILKQITSKAKYTHLELLQFAINNLEELLEK